MQLSYQQQGSVDVDVLEHNELSLHFDRQQPRTVQLSFHPVPHTAVLPFKGSGQSPDRREEGQQEARVLGSEGGLRPCAINDSGNSLLQYKYNKVTTMEGVGYKQLNVLKVSVVKVLILQQNVCLSVILIDCLNSLVQWFPI